MRKVTIIGIDWKKADGDEILAITEALSDREVLFVRGVHGVHDFEVTEHTQERAARIEEAIAVANPRTNGCTVVGVLPVPKWVDDLHPVM